MQDLKSIQNHISSEGNTSHEYLYYTPQKLRKLHIEQLEDVCKAIRSEIIRVCAEKPGHLASSLGVVELTVALHYVFDTPNDALVWDVGHQSYAHKILTGRGELFTHLREKDGMRPFISPLESEYDVNVCGHASNSISVALGLAVSYLHNADKKDKKVVAIIGDGAMSGGLAFEGLNNVSSIPNNLLIILNDNNMSVSGSVGSIGQQLQRMHTSGWYNKLRFQLAQRLTSIGWLNDKRRKTIIRFNNAMKSIIVGQQNIFEGLNIRYFGPTDGHNVVELVRILREIKEMKEPHILHIHTIKGKGFEAAEKDPVTWHAPGKFDANTGERQKVNTDNLPPKFQDVFGETLLELADKDSRIIGVTPAMLTGCSMNKMQAKYPERVYDVGIAEGHAVTFSAGLATGGMIPFCNIYSSFSQRAYDNVIHDLAISQLPVVLCFDRAGIVGEDGPTHHGVFDMAAFRAVPNVSIAVPRTGKDLRRLMFTAVKNYPNLGPLIIRYPRGRCKDLDWQCPLESMDLWKGKCLVEGNDIAVLSVGPVGNVVADCIRSLSGQKSVALYDMVFVKPLDKELLNQIANNFSKIVTIEDGCKKGGFGSAVLEYLTEQNYRGQVKILGVPDQFVEHGTPAELYHQIGLDKEGILKALL